LKLMEVYFHILHQEVVSVQHVQEICKQNTQFLFSKYRGPSP